MKLHWSVKRGGISVKRTKSTCSHYYIHTHHCTHAITHTHIHTHTHTHSLTVTHTHTQSNISILPIHQQIKRQIPQALWRRCPAWCTLQHYLEEGFEEDGVEDRQGQVDVAHVTRTVSPRLTAAGALLIITAWPWQSQWRRDALIHLLYFLKGNWTEEACWHET